MLDNTRVESMVFGLAGPNEGMILSSNTKKPNYNIRSKMIPILLLIS